MARTGVCTACMQSTLSLSLFNRIIIIIVSFSLYHFLGSFFHSTMTHTQRDACDNVHMAPSVHSIFLLEIECLIFFFVNAITFVMFFLMHHFARIIIVDGNRLKAFVSHKIGFTQWYVCAVWFGTFFLPLKFIGNINKIDTVSHIVDIVTTATAIATAFKVYDWIWIDFIR